MTGVILFRAQPFHNGHLAQIKRAYKDIEKFGGNLYVIVGSADKYGTKRNPIPISTRLDLIMGALKDEFKSEELQRIHVVPFNDLSDEANTSSAQVRSSYAKLPQSGQSQRVPLIFNFPFSHRSSRDFVT